MSKIKQKLATLGCATTFLAGSIGLVSVPPASAATMTCTLRITDWWQDSLFERYEWSCANRPVADKIEYANFWGSDPWYDEDDFLYREYDAFYDFRWGTLSDAQLNEDGNDEGDEIYVVLLLRRPNGTRYSVRTSRIRRGPVTRGGVAGSFSFLAPAARSGWALVVIRNWR
jgi:hypothetical protein